MVFEYNKLPFDLETSFQCAFDPTSQFDCGSQFTSSAHRHIPEKRHFPDMPPLNSKDHGRAPDVTSDLSCVTGSNEENIKLDNCKRLLDDDENSQAAAKRTRHTDNTENSNHIIHEEPRLDPLIRLSYFPGYYEDHHWSVGYDQLEETDSYILDCLPRKLVSIGPDHQAELPILRSKGELNDEDISSKWIKHCIEPVPDSSSLDFKASCHCLDQGSIACVRQHVTDAREQLKIILGHDHFLELGLCEMGEQVALNWSEEEQQLFNEIVILNPASIGRNFWDVLPRAFPSRSNKEFVSYYFNVFMLRKRAEQNRSDLLNIDSDNDEWQDCVYNENDSGVESPEDAEAKRDSCGIDIHEGDECNDDDENGRFDGNAKVHDHDVHDDSCTSYDHEVVGHCDPNSWDIDHFPACNAIEEVFSNESLEKKRDEHGAN